MCTQVVSNLIQLLGFSWILEQNCVYVIVCIVWLEVPSKGMISVKQTVVAESGEAEVELWLQENPISMICCTVWFLVP